MCIRDRRWGDRDERGTLNLITPEVVAAAARLVHTGKVYSLALPLQRKGVPHYEVPRGVPQRFSLTGTGDAGLWARAGHPEGSGYNEDILMVASHAATHMDALCHVYAGDAIYNGYPASSFSTVGGASRCDIAKTGTFAGRGVLLDLPRHFDVEWLEPGHLVDADELEACAAAQGVEVRSGDIVCVRTGWLDAFAAGEADLESPQPGLSLDAVRFLDDHDVAAVGADNSGVERLPFEGGWMSVHIELIVKRGITLLEHLVLAELAADGCHEFLLCVGALPYKGAAGSPINPVAIG